MSYADSLRQQARWIREALDPATPETQRIDLGDVDTDELDAAADEIERLRGVLSRIKNLPDTPSDELATAINMAYDALR